MRALGETSDENCPVCNIPLMHAALAKIRILYCTKCRGMLVRMEVLQSLVDELRVLEGGTFIQPAADEQGFAQADSLSALPQADGGTSLRRPGERVHRLL